MFAFYKKKIRKAHNHRRLIPCRFQVTSEAKRIGCSSTQTVTSPSAVRDDCGKDSCLQTSTADAMYAALSTSIFFTCLGALYRCDGGTTTICGVTSASKGLFVASTGRCATFGRHGMIVARTIVEKNAGHRLSLCQCLRRVQAWRHHNHLSRVRTGPISVGHHVKYILHRWCSRSRVRTIYCRVARAQHVVNPSNTRVYIHTYLHPSSLT